MLLALLLVGNTGVIEGTVRDAAGAPVARALVAAVDYANPDNRSDASALVESAADGRFRLEPLTPGEYGLTATSPGRTAVYQGHVKVKSAETARVNLTLGAA